MKIFSKISFILSLSLILISFKGIGQGNPILGSFTANENNGQILLSWNIVKGSTCNGIQIFRSTNNLDFSEIGSIAGLCGSSSTSTFYNFTDLFPEKNKINYYKLNLGNFGPSEIVYVEIVSIDNGYLIRPHPITDNSKLFFKNDFNRSCILTVFNMNGNTIYTFVSNEDHFILRSDLFLTGIYFFRITTKEFSLITSGKLVIGNN